MGRFLATETSRCQPPLVVGTVPLHSENTQGSGYKNGEKTVPFHTCHTVDYARANKTYVLAGSFYTTKAFTQKL